MINHYTVIGQPVAHSLSPAVHQIFGELTQRKIHYTRTESTPELFAETVAQWRDSGGRGCNITAPFKELAATVCNRLSRGAENAGSVNTILFQSDGTMVGHNTDGAGLVEDIVKNKRYAIQGRRVLILGAGGAARGVVAAILAAQPEKLHITNRTSAKASALANLFADQGAVSAAGFDSMTNRDKYDLVINATSTGLSNEMLAIPDGIMSDDALAYDMTYATADTSFMHWARQQGHDAVNGLGMLVEQAAESFLIWEGVRPKTRLVYPRLHEIIQ